MPTNVTPEYKKAEASYRKARDPAERLSWLREMLRTIPKHKGTEHLQADIKTRIKELTTDLKGPRKGGSRTGPVHTVRPEGAAQVSLVGPPNSGKSRLHACLTGSQAEIGPYPHTTNTPLPGMLPHRDIQIQLVDLPPISNEFMESWMPNALQPAHATLLVVDLHELGVAENVAAIRERLGEKRIVLTGDWGGRLTPGRLYTADDLLTMPPNSESAALDTPSAEMSSVREGQGESLEAMDDPFLVNLPTLLVANKCDLGLDPEEIAVLAELTGAHFPALAASAQTGEGLGLIGPLLCHGLGIVRVYTKVPGKPPDTARPFTVFAGETVEDVARLIHKDVFATLKYARVWGSAKFDGQQVGRDYQVHDGDVLELHT